ncbi:MAG TPA: efflux RND transporter periplasmic adaptor subunit [Polyangiales bacterium]|nr:efflux RND transporter periplasmic adaptor subunit [Polyangiales bacterium]
MSNSLSSDLASLKIDREAKPRQGGPLRAILGVLLLAGLVLAGYVVGKPYLEAQVFRTPVQITEISLVSPAQASVELSSSGYVVPQVRSQVGARIPGRVAKLFVKEGDRVEQGQVLIELERADQLAAIQSAKLRVAAARARAATARATVEEVRTQAQRTQALVQRGAAAQAQADDLNARLVSLTEQVKATDAEASAVEAEIETLKLNLGHMTIVAPITGTVLNKPPEVGEVLGNDFGIGTTTTGVIELADFNTLVVETDVPEGRLHLVRIGSPCEIVLDAYPSRRYRGEAIEIMPRVNRAKASVGVKVKFVDAAEAVLPDMSARVSFLAKALDVEQMKEQPKTIVPGSAIVERSGSKVVFVVDGDRVRIAPVKLGAAFGDGFELADGPAPGTKVVKSPPEVLQDGNKIKERTGS